MTWFQLNGQFIWSWFKDHPLTLCLFGVPVSYLYIVATKYSFEAFNELLWPGRFLGFAASDHDLSSNTIIIPDNVGNNHLDINNRFIKNENAIW